MILVKQLQAPAAITASGNTGSVDTLGYGVAMISLSVGAVAGTTPTLNAVLQDSPDNATWTNVTSPNSGAFPQITATPTGVFLMSVNMQYRHRYLRLAYTIGGTSPSFTLSANCHLMRGLNEDPTQDNAVVIV